MNVILAVLWKDLVTEWRTRERFVAMTVFVLLVVVIFHFAAPAGPDLENRTHLPGLLWVSYIFAAILGLNRSLALELENEALSGLAMTPGNRGFIYLGKMLANTILLYIVEIIAAIAFTFAFGFDVLTAWLPFAGIALLGAVGICSIGTLFATVSVRTTYREVMLPLLLLPMLVPTLLASVEATTEIVAGRTMPQNSLRLLITGDAIFLIVSFLGFEYILDE